MSYIIGLIAVAVFFSALHYFTELNYKQKIGISVFMALVIALMYAWNVKESKLQEHTNAILLKYSQNERVTCSGIDVNQSTFSLSNQTFIGIAGTKNAGEMYSAETCE